MGDFNLIDELNQLLKGSYINVDESNLQQGFDLLKQKVKFLESIINNLPIAVYINDCKSKQQVWGNPLAEKRLGVPIEDLKNKDIEWYLSHYHPDDIKVIKESILTFTEQRDTEFSGVYRIKPEGDDQWRWSYSKSTVFTKDQNGKNELILGIAVDLSHEMNTKNQMDLIMKENIKLANKLILDSLTKREKQILHYISKGFNTKEIAKTLDISPHTVNSHRKVISKKLRLHCMASLAAFAVENGL
ncbi:MAG: PAS domain-containing protein [Bacteroidetes bacterium]|nr:PAS domain-containing protein [Bacteroidota bacterium]